MMKISVILLLVVVSVSALSVDAQEWYKIEENEEYIADFALRAGESKAISIDSPEPIRIGFRSSAFYAPNRNDLYKELSKKYGSKVIKLIDKGSRNSLATVWAASGRIKPVANKVNIEIVNLTDMDFKIVVYKKKE